VGRSRCWSQRKRLFSGRFLLFLPFLPDDCPNMFVEQFVH
jgi:hypothetical protein